MKLGTCVPEQSEGVMRKIGSVETCSQAYYPLYFKCGDFGDLHSTLLVKFY